MNILEFARIHPWWSVFFILLFVHFLLGLFVFVRACFVAGLRYSTFEEKLEYLFKNLFKGSYVFYRMIIIDYNPKARAMRRQWREEKKSKS